MGIFRMFKIKKEEQWLALAMLLVFVAFNALVIAAHYSAYTQGAQGGFWSIFTRNFRMSGYDCWSWITVSGMRIHFVTSRHPLYLTFLYPLYLLNHWLIETVGINFAVYLMAAVIVFSALYAGVFTFRVFREIIGLKRCDATILTLLLFSFGHILVPAMVPDHFIVSLMLLSMTMYIVGKKMMKGRQLGAWQSFALNFFTAGMATSNGIKTLLAGLFANGRRFFARKYLLVGVVLPFLLLVAIQQSQYYLLEMPQKTVVRQIEKAAREKNPQAVAAHYRKRNDWQRSHMGKPAGNGAIGQLMDVSTPRGETLVENFFGESIQLHQDYLLKDVSWERPIFVPYRSTANYVVEGLIVLLFLISILFGCRQRFFQMLLAWLACDVTLHLVLGFAINEIYIMTAGWAFVIPISYGYIQRVLSPTPQCVFRWLLGLLTLYLWIYNGGQTACYLLNI